MVNSGRYILYAKWSYVKLQVKTKVSNALFTCLFLSPEITWLQKTFPIKIQGGDLLKLNTICIILCSYQSICYHNFFLGRCYLSEKQVTADCPILFHRAFLTFWEIKPYVKVVTQFFSFAWRRILLEDCVTIPLYF